MSVTLPQHGTEMWSCVVMKTCHSGLYIVTLVTAT